MFDVLMEEGSSAADTFGVAACGSFGISVGVHSLGISKIGSSDVFPVGVEVSERLDVDGIVSSVLGRTGASVVVCCKSFSDVSEVIFSTLSLLTDNFYEREAGTKVRTSSIPFTDVVSLSFVMD